MKGSIRVFAGLLLTLGVVGGIDMATDAQLIPLLMLAGIGLGIMASGVKALNNPTR
jgi:hypothetical protein